MDLKTYVSERGRQTSLAAEIGAQPQLVWQWANDVRPVPENRCPAIERASLGVVSCEELRPDLAWARIKDRDWPWHPRGRPVMDLTREAVAGLTAAAPQ